MRSKLLAMLLILVALATAVEGPVLYAGWRNLDLGERAAAQGQYLAASEFYAQAAHQLPWRRDLTETAGLAAFRGGSPAGAIQLLQKAAARAPLSRDGSVALGSALWTTGQAQAAIAAWQAGLEWSPSDAALLDRLIAAYDQQRDYRDEQTALLGRLAAGQDASASYRLGLLLMTRDEARADRLLETAASEEPRFESAATTLRATLDAAATQQGQAAHLVVIGRGLGLVGEWGIALEAFRQATAADAGNAQAWAWLGEAQQHVDEDGKSALDEALRLGPQDAVVHGLLALYWARHGDDQTALAEQKQAARIDPGNPALQMALGEAYAAAGDLVSALSTYQQATNLAPGDPATWKALASFCANNGVEVDTVGLPAALKAVSLAPHDAASLDLLGWSYALIGLPEAAKVQLAQAVQAAPDSAAPHLHLAETYLQTADYASAQQELNRTIELDPDGPNGQLATRLLAQFFPH